MKCLKRLELTYEDFSSLKKHCDEAGIIFLSTPYDTDSVDTLVRLDIEAIKIASTDNTNTPFLAYVGGTGKPVIISTGMATLGETEKAINVLKNSASAERIIALHCTTEYPTPLEEVNLKVINTLKTAFDIPVGYSDHTEGIGASPWAVAVGACMIEKHITLDKQLPGPDHKASLDVREFAELIKQVRNVEIALGDGIKRITQSELANKKLMQKSIVVKEGIKKGEIITIEKVAIMRPGTGLAPELIESIIGKTAAMDIPAQTVLMLQHINWE